MGPRDILESKRGKLKIVEWNSLKELNVFNK